MCEDCDVNPDFPCECDCDFVNESGCKKCLHLEVPERDELEEIWEDYVDNEVHSIRGY